MTRFAPLFLWKLLLPALKVTSLPLGQYQLPRLSCGSSQQSSRSVRHSNDWLWYSLLFTGVILEDSENWRISLTSTRLWLDKVYSSQSQGHTNYVMRYHLPWCITCTKFLACCPSVRGKYKCAAANSKGTSPRQLLPANAITNISWTVNCIIIARTRGWGWLHEYCACAFVVGAQCTFSTGIIMGMQWSHIYMQEVNNSLRFPGWTAAVVDNNSQFLIAIHSFLNSSCSLIVAGHLVCSYQNSVGPSALLPLYSLLILWNYTVRIDR